MVPAAPGTCAEANAEGSTAAVSLSRRLEEALLRRKGREKEQKKREREPIEEFPARPQAEADLSATVPWVEMNNGGVLADVDMENREPNTRRRVEAPAHESESAEMKAMRAMMQSVVAANNCTLSDTIEKKLEVKIGQKVGEAVKEQLVPVHHQLKDMERRLRVQEEKGEAGAGRVSRQWQPGFISFGVCSNEDRQTQGLGYGAAKEWWQCLRAELPEDIASQTNENPTRMGNKLSSIRITIKGDARQFAFCLRDHMGSLDSHKLNGTVPRVGWERTPEDSLDYKVMGHVQKRAMLLKKRRATAEPWEI